MDINQVVMTGTIYCPQLAVNSYREMTPEYRQIKKRYFQFWIDRYEGPNNYAVRVTEDIYIQAKTGLNVLNEIIKELDHA